MFTRLRKAIRALEDWLGEAKFHPQVLQDLYEIEQRALRAEDDRRIYRRADVDVDELRLRMRDGKRPPRTILEEVASSAWRGDARAFLERRKAS